MCVTRPRKGFKMGPCSKIEIASIIFAFLSLLGSAYGCCMLTKYVVQVSIKMVNLIKTEDKLSHSDVQSLITSWGLHTNIINATMLSFLIIVFSFSIILINGLLSKKSYLVKAYFIYGATVNTISTLFAIYVILAADVKFASFIFLGCVVQGLILAMIRKTYLNIATAEKCNQKNIDAEKTMSIRL